MNKGTWIRGLQAGLHTTLVLSKIIVPVTLVVTIIKHTPIIHWLVSWFTPLMGMFGLPGEAAMVLGLGFILNLYAAIGAMSVLTLTSYHIFVLALMLSFSHNLLVEVALAKKAGLSATVVATLRIGTAFLAAGLIHLFTGPQEMGSVTGTQAAFSDPYFWNMPTMEFLIELVKSVWNAVIPLAMIVIPLMFGIQVLKELNVISKLSKWTIPFTKFLGLSEQSAVPLLAGIFFGLAFGAGVILQATKEHPLSKRELYLTFIFLILCHAVVEDTLLFVPLGVNGFLLLGLRLTAAIVITAGLARVWQEQKIQQNANVEA